MSLEVTLSPYERALNQLNDLPRNLDKVFSEALEDLRRQRDEARAQVERLTSAVPGLAESGPYTMADVERIEAHRGKPYARLRATVGQVERVRAWAGRRAEHPHAWEVVDALEGK